MSQSSYGLLRSVDSFESLVQYLREELDWPIQEADFDDLMFDYDPDELGIDPSNSAKIESIRQLRPLVTGQPWGIFSIEFSRRRLPVVALRRILSHLVVKKRTSLQASEQAIWELGDLLFISSTGEGSDRRIGFAHFSQEHDSSLPTLRVLGWDGHDTDLHVQHVVAELAEKLRWPDDESNLPEWRDRWASAFTLRHRETITTSRALAERLAELASGIRRRVSSVLEVETDRGHLRQLMAAARTTLIHDLKPEDFADMYAQTVAYGLLSARVSRPQEPLGLNAIEGFSLANPLLKDLMDAFLRAGAGAGGSRKGSSIDFDELGINDVIETLGDANMEAVLRDFGDRNPAEDPVIHFYELFLQEYDAERRIRRGVFYTPRPVVSFIVRCVDEILRTQFGLGDGLADTTTWGEMVHRHPRLVVPEGVDSDTPFIHILDPAAGSGTFLVEVIQVIHETMVDKWTRDGHLELELEHLWNSYIQDDLLPRLYGFELMMAPYAVAHMKIDLKLCETGYNFPTTGTQRARVFLTNTLEPPATTAQVQVFAPALAHEAEASNVAKSSVPFTVVVGNPPYGNYGRLNRGQWILSLLEDYKRGLDEKKLNLDDDYLKFWRYAQWRIGQTGIGVQAMITNSSYLDGLVHRRMRESLIEDYDEILLLDLHGNANRREVAPDGRPDKNVFDIRQGVAVSICYAGPDGSGGARVSHADAWGLREEKHRRLRQLSLKEWRTRQLEPTSPDFFFKPLAAGADDYAAAASLVDVLTLHGSGFNTDRDDLCMDFDGEELARRMQILFSGDYGDDFREQYNVFPSSSYDVESRARTQSYRSDAVRQCIYRPFDLRWVYYGQGFTSRPVFKVQGNMLAPNLALLAARQSKEPFAVFVTRGLSAHKIVAVYDRTSVFPLYSYTLDKAESRACGVASHNLSSSFISRLKHDLGFSWADEQQAADGVDGTIGPEDALHYLYALFHTPSYRSRYEDRLRVDFPRVFVPAGPELFATMVQLGADLVGLHLLDDAYERASWGQGSGPLAASGSRYFGQDTPSVARGYPKRRGDRVLINESSGFCGIDDATWEFRIGGYQVCRKWLIDRGPKKGKPAVPLDSEQIATYARMLAALSETSRVMTELDAAVEEQGGWEGAFPRS